MDVSFGDSGPPQVSNVAYSQFQRKEHNQQKGKLIELEKEFEFRFEVEFDNTITIQLIQGTAESFGTELALQQLYSFGSGCNASIFTWHGCTLEITGQCHYYIANETPMISYLNIHNAIDLERNSARERQCDGPRVMLVGPCDSGKTTLSKIFLSYAVRSGSQPMFVDIDIGQGSITVPGMLSALQISQPVPVGQGDISSNAPIVYFYGHLNPSENVKLYKLQIANLVKDIKAKCENNADVRASGLIVNTCGWVDGLGFDLLLYSIDTLMVDTVLVIDHERLFSDLSRKYSNASIRMVKLIKSGGVITRSQPYRRKMRIDRIREYFYGCGKDTLYPYQTVLDFKEVIIYKIGGGPQAPSSALPIGASPTMDPVRLIEISPCTELVHSLLGVVHAKSPETILVSNLAGFLIVTEVNLERQKLTCLIPCPGPLPSRYLLLGSLKFLE